MGVVVDSPAEDDAALVCRREPVRFFLDTEFTNLPWDGGSELLWVALVNEGGDQKLSMINADCPMQACSPFVREHVLPHLRRAHVRAPRAKLACTVPQFVGSEPEFWAWQPSLDDLTHLATPADALRLHSRYKDWDYQLLRGLFDDVPASWPSACADLHALADRTGVALPDNPHPHDPLCDAEWGRLLWLRAQQAPE
jgi:hypothetical protein